MHRLLCLALAPPRLRRPLTVVRSVLLLFLALGLALSSAAREIDFPDPVASGDPASGRLRVLGPDGAPGTECPLEHTDVRVTVAGFVARVRVVQRCRNPGPDPIEAIYTFPMSERGAVDAMWMRTGGREVRGEIHRREEARRLYENARAAGQVAALLDQERPNIFTQSVANVMPGAQVEIEIHYVETLKFEAGSFSFSFPTVVGPRFIPAALDGQARVPDASRISPPVTPEGRRAGHDIQISVDLDAGVPIRDVVAPLHEIEVERGPQASRALVRLASREEIPNRDFVLRWKVSADDIQSGTLAHRMPGEDGFITLMLLPPERVAPERAAPKELVFVIDRSGSQRGLPLAKAKETLLWILEHMHPQDTFQVIDFGGTANRLFDRPRPASTSMKAQARRYVEALQANGGTMMAEAIREVAATPAEGGRLRIVTFMTDGYIGNDHEVLSLVREVRGTSRWFPFGTGNSVNRYLIEGMAREGGGQAEFVLLADSGDAVARRFWKRISSPVLTDVQVHFEGGDVFEVYPGEVADVWADRPLVFHARYARAGRGRVVIEGRRGGRPYREVHELEFPERARDHDALGSIWARAKVDDLLRRDLQALQSGSFPASVREAVVEVALAHQLVTPFTSFVAVEDRVVNEGGVTRTVPVPVEMPQGVTYEGVFGEAGVLAQTPGAPGRSAKMARASSGTGALHSLGSLADRAVQESPGERRVRSGRDVIASQPAMDLAARITELQLDAELAKRLAPEIALLLTRGASAVPLAEVRDGRVRVRVKTRGLDISLRRALERAGLSIQLSGDQGWVVGWVALDALPALARVEGVVEVGLPTPHVQSAPAS